MIRIHSFDVFDTCLFRRVPTPSGIVPRVAEKTFAHLGLPLTEARRENFIAARLNAEREAYAQKVREDITLEDIWRRLAEAMGWTYAPVFPTFELEAEDEALGPICTMRTRVAAARQEGHRIVFVSDMYLPTDFVRRQLMKHGFAAEGDGVYVSSETGKTKATGNLFKHVLATESVAAHEYLHIGDNRKSDDRVPRRLGIGTELVTKAHPTPTEIELLRLGRHAASMTRVLGAMRAFRLGLETDDEDVHAIASDFIAPFVMGLAVWVLETARKQNVKRLYFLSRDCQVVFKVARELAPQFGGIECRYLYLSRQVLYLAGLTETTPLSPEGLPWMRRDFEFPILGTLLAKLDLRYDDVAPFLGDLAQDRRGDYRLASEEDWRRFWQALNEAPVRMVLHRRLAEHQKLTRRYLESEGLFESTSWALVDFGWSLSCQKALMDAFAVWGARRDVLGYYLGLLLKRVAPREAGETEALFYERPPDLGADKAKSGIFDCVPLLEHVVGCADHPTVHHYEEMADGKIGPGFTGQVSEAITRLCHQLHTGAVEFARRNPGLAEDFRDPDFCRDALAHLAATFFHAPGEAQARALSALPVGIDQNGLDLVPLARPLSVTDALLPLIPKADKVLPWLTRNPRPFWVGGSWALTPRWTQSLARVVLRVVWLRIKIQRYFWPR